MSLPSTVARVVLVALVPAVTVGAADGTATARPVAPTTAEPSGTWPLQPQPPVVAPFRPPVERWLAGHRGVDLQGRPGQPVLASLAGVVTFAGTVAGRGVLVVSHGARRTTYQPVAATVRVGTRVRAGQQLGLLQVAGSHCWLRACLHWGLREGETYLDPLGLVGLTPIRLLPLQGPGPVGGGARGLAAPRSPSAAAPPVPPRAPSPPAPWSSAPPGPPLPPGPWLEGPSSPWWAPSRPLA